jgi:hypothetical protein
MVRATNLESRKERVGYNSTTFDPASSHSLLRVSITRTNGLRRTRRGRTVCAHDQPASRDSRPGRQRSQVAHNGRRGRTRPTSHSYQRSSGMSYGVRPKNFLSYRTFSATRRLARATTLALVELALRTPVVSRLPARTATVSGQYCASWYVADSGLRCYNRQADHRCEAESRDRQCRTVWFCIADERDPPGHLRLARIEHFERKVSVKTSAIGVLGGLSIDCDACVPVMFSGAMKQ